MSTAKIHDVRYRTYDGEVRGNSRRAIFSMARWSALRALGARRPWTAKVVPVGLAVIALGPAVTALGVRALLGPQITEQLPGGIIPYAPYYQLIGFAILAYAAIVIPETICPDRRSRLLDLYLSTALGPRDYVLGKIFASLGPLLAVTTLPLAVLYIGNMFFAEYPLGYVQANLREIPAILVGGLLIALVYTLLGLAVASLTSRRAFATVGFVLLLIVSSLVDHALSQIAKLGPNTRLLDLQNLPIWLAQKIIGGSSGSLTTGPLAPVETPSLALLIIANAVIIGVCVGVLALRYRRSAK